ncbi:MAG: type II secretion system protein [Coriobacteriia bacterium]|nr:type II secretion system protein [Coriobacteriia bacterium]
MRMFRKDEGFTLVELMVVVLIIGILVAIAIPVFNAATKTARERTCHSNERTVEGAVEQYLAADPNYTVAGDDWAALMAKLVPGYIKAEPTCPENGTYTFDDTAKTVTCDVHGHF